MTDIPESENTDDANAVTVWATAQAAPSTQRSGRYHPDSVKHPAKMLPAIAAHAIEAYTQPGDLVLDPMCGIGTTLVEALRADRRAVGVEYETRWAELARTNIDLARTEGFDLDAAIYQGDARKLSSLLPDRYRGQIDLVITSPPYGDSTHGHVRVKPGEGVRKYDHRYGAVLDRGNLANVGIGRLLSGFTRILNGVSDYLKPGGHVVITARPWRQHAELIDLPTHITTCGTHAGRTPGERCVSLLGRLAQEGIVARSSFFQRDFIVKNRRGGLPVHLIAHEDVLVFQRRENRASTREPKHRQRGPVRPPVLPGSSSFTVDPGSGESRAA